MLGVLIFLCSFFSLNQNVIMVTLKESLIDNLITLLKKKLVKYQLSSALFCLLSLFNGKLRLLSQ